MAEFPVIETNRLILRNFRNSDIDSVHDIFAKGIITESYDSTSITEYSQVKDIINNRILQNSHLLEYGARWAIELKSDHSKLIGSCGYHNINRSNCSFEIGYELHPDHWNNGYAFEAVSTMITHCFCHNFPFFLNKISAAATPDSTRSIALLKKLGFSEDDIQGENGVCKDNIPHVRWFSLHRQDFFKI